MTKIIWILYKLTVDLDESKTNRLETLITVKINFVDTNLIIFPKLYLFTPFYGIYKKIFDLIIKKMYVYLRFWMEWGS